MNKIIRRKKNTLKIIDIIFNYIKENKRYYLISVGLFLIGFIIAIVSINSINSEQINEISEYIKQLCNNLKNTEKIDYIYLLKQSVFSNVFIVFFIWVASSTIIGIPFIYFIITYRGFILGYTINSILLTYGLKDGTIYNLATLLFHNLIFFPILLTTAVSGMKAYRSIVKNKEKENIKLEFLRHTIFSLIMLILLIISSIIEVYFSTNLSKIILEFIKI